MVRSPTRRAPANAGQPERGPYRPVRVVPTRREQGSAVRAGAMRVAERNAVRDVSTPEPAPVSTMAEAVRGVTMWEPAPVRARVRAVRGVTMGEPTPVRARAGVVRGGEPPPRRRAGRAVGRLARGERRRGGRAIDRPEVPRACRRRTAADARPGALPRPAGPADRPGGLPGQAEPGRRRTISPSRARDPATVDPTGRAASRARPRPYGRATEAAGGAAEVAPGPRHPGPRAVEGWVLKDLPAMGERRFGSTRR